MAYRLNHIHFKSPDPKKTAQWYVEYLGAKVVSENQGADGKTYTLRLNLHGLSIVVTGFIEGQELKQHYGLEHVAIESSEFDAHVARIKATGTKVLEEHTLPDGHRGCFFEGPEGVRLEFLDWRPEVRIL